MSEQKVSFLLERHSRCNSLNVSTEDLRFCEVVPESLMSRINWYCILILQ